MGGWRGTTGWLPTAPAATVTFRVPQPQTEVRLGQAVDRRMHETQRPDETIETALGPGGALQLQWRPKVAEAQVDRGLTVETAGLLDIEEDGLRMALHIKLEFRRSQRDDFTLSLPADYLVEKVAGSNVRGWEVRRAAERADRRGQPAQDGQGQRAVQPLPLAQRQSGAGPAGHLRRAHGHGPRRRALQRAVDHPPQSAPGRPHHGAIGRDADRPGPAARSERRTGDRGERAGDSALRGLSLPHDALRAAAERRAHRCRSDRRGPDERQARSDRAGPGEQDHLPRRPAEGLSLRGRRARRSPLAGSDVARRRGYGRSRKQESSETSRSAAAKRPEDPPAARRAGRCGSDPARQAGPPWTPSERLPCRGWRCWGSSGRRAISPCRPIRPSTSSPASCATARRPSWSGSPPGSIRSCGPPPAWPCTTPAARMPASCGWSPRTPEVVCDTVTNVRVTDRAIEETIFLNYSIRNAGIHELTFLLPASMADARISTPMLRRKTVAARRSQGRRQPACAVRLELQGDVMNDLRVLVENDRLLTPGSAGPHTAPLPPLKPPPADGRLRAAPVRRAGNQQPR